MIIIIVELELVIVVVVEHLLLHCASSYSRQWRPEWLALPTNYSASSLVEVPNRMQCLDLLSLHSLRSFFP